jgi:hypothetical protein
MIRRRKKTHNHEKHKPVIRNSRLFVPVVVNFLKYPAYVKESICIV